MARLNLGKELVDLIHPVGSTVFNKNADFNPNNLWIGTTWENLGCCVLMGCDPNDSNYNNPGTYVGSNYHTMTIDELVTHGHNLYSGYGSNGSTGQDAIEFKQGIGSRSYYNAGTGAVKFIQDSGSSKPFSIVQRSYLGYWWIRTR